MPTEITAPVQVSVANTNRDGTGTLVTVVTPDENGSYVDQVDIVAVGTVTAGFIRLFTDDGTNTRLEAEIPVPATTPAVGVTPVWSTVWRPSPALFLPSTWLLKACTHIGETFNLKARKRPK